MDEVYRPPFKTLPRVIVDLGANIGLTSLYFSHRFGPSMLIAIEPDPDNARLAKHNLEGLPATVIEAAIGSADGTAWFRHSSESNLGYLADVGGSSEVQLISMNTVLEMIPDRHVDLLKVDIEGGEQALFTVNTEWLRHVQAIIAEFHPRVVNYDALVALLVDQGFRYIPAGRAWSGSMDAFVRP